MSTYLAIISISCLSGFVLLTPAMYKKYINFKHQRLYREIIRMNTALSEVLLDQIEKSKDNYTNDEVKHQLIEVSHKFLTSRNENIQHFIENYSRLSNIVTIISENDQIGIMIDDEKYITINIDQFEIHDT